MKRFLALMLGAFMIIQAPTDAKAEIREATYEVQGVHFLAPFNRFPDALLIEATEGQANGIPHMHVEWLIKDGFIQSRDELVGQCAIVFSQWVRDADGNMHQNAYVPNDEMGLRIVPCGEAMGFDAKTSDQYLEESMDVEAQRQKGLGSSGSTPTHEGHRRGAD